VEATACACLQAEGKISRRHVAKSISNADPHFGTSVCAMQLVATGSSSLLTSLSSAGQLRRFVGRCHDLADTARLSPKPADPGKAQGIPRLVGATTLPPKRPCTKHGRDPTHFVPAACWDVAAKDPIFTTRACRCTVTARTPCATLLSIKSLALPQNKQSCVLCETSCSLADEWC
jgi:hypothetical protein